MADSRARSRFSASQSVLRRPEESKRSPSTANIRQVSKNIDLALVQHDKVMAEAEWQLSQSQTSVQSFGEQVQEQIVGLAPQFRSQVEGLLADLRGHILVQANETQKLLKQIQQLTKETQSLSMQGVECEKKLEKVEHTLSPE